jgi:hypothetical protein
MNATILIELGKMTCEVHHEPPVLDLEDGKLHVATCCPDFHERIDTKFLELSQNLLNSNFGKE